MIETRDLTKMYGDLYALNRLSIKLERGDVYGFIGPNGAGKTTTMRILATLLNPTWGEASVCGYSIYNGAKEIRRLIGYMPRYAPYAAKMPGWFNARDKYPGLAKLSEKFVGLSTRRTLPQWRKDAFTDPKESQPQSEREVVLLADWILAALLLSRAERGESGGCNAGEGVIGHAFQAELRWVVSAYPGAEVCERSGCYK